MWLQLLLTLAFSGSKDFQNIPDEKVPTVYPGEIIRWAPDLPVFAYSGFVREGEARCRVRALYFYPDNKNPIPLTVQDPIQLLTDPNGVLEDEYICRDILAFGWGTKGRFFYLTRYTDARDADLVLGTYADAGFKEDRRFKLSDHQWKSIYGSGLLFGGSHLFFCMNRENRNAIMVADLSEAEFNFREIRLSREFHNLRSITFRQIGDTARVVFSAREHQDARYKLFTFDILGPGDLAAPKTPLRVTTGKVTLNEHFPKLNVSGEEVVFYGIEGDKAYAAVYTANLRDGEPKRVDQLASGVQQGLPGTSAEATYCWSADGTWIYYIVRNDEENDPIMYRDSLLAGKEWPLKTGLIHRLIDISPFHGKLATMAYTIIDGAAAERPYIFAPGIKSHRFPVFVIKLPEGVSPNVTSLEGADSENYNIHFLKGVIRLVPKTMERIEWGRALDLTVVMPGRRHSIYNRRQLEWDFSNITTDSHVIIVDSSNLAEPRFDNLNGVLSFSPLSPSTGEVVALMGAPNFKSAKNTEQGFRVELAENVEVLSLGKPGRFKLVLPNQSQAASADLRLRGQMTRLELRPVRDLIKINLIPDQSEKTEGFIANTVRRVKSEYQDRLSLIRTYNSDKNMEFPLFENRELSGEILKTIIALCEEEGHTTVFEWIEGDSFYLLKIEVRGG